MSSSNDILYSKGPKAPSDPTTQSRDDNPNELVYDSFKKKIENPYNDFFFV